MIIEPLVWYAAYASNLSAARLRYYLRGGTMPGGRWTYPGCRDGRDARRTVPLMVPGGIYFALESKVWTGGLAFYDPRLPGSGAVRAYLLTEGQFADVVAQEMHREPAGDLADVIAEAARTGRVALGPGRYETLHCLGLRDGHPVLTFTAPWSCAEVALNPPAAAYLATLASGLHESHGWSPARIVAYLGGCPGVAGHWSDGDLRAVVEGAADRATVG